MCDNSVYSTFKCEKCVHSFHTLHDKWSYEKEWRLIPEYLDIKQECPFHYVICKPKAIIMCSKMEDEKKEEIISIAKDDSYNIFEASISDSSPDYSLIFKPVV